MPLDVLLTAEEVAYHLDDSDAVALVAWQGFFDAAHAAFLRTDGSKHLIVVKADPTDTGAAPGCVTCTADACDLAAGCSHTDIDGKTCDDDNPCIVGDLCAKGGCLPGAPKICQSGKPCVTAECSLVDGKCVLANSQTSLPCNDGSARTVADACGGGQCAGQVLACDDGEVGTIDACAAVTGGGHSALRLKRRWPYRTNVMNTLNRQLILERYTDACPICQHQ